MYCYTWASGLSIYINVVSCQKHPPEVFLKISQKSQENTCAWVSFLIKLKFIKKRLWHLCFPVIFVKFIRTPFLQNTSWRLLLSCEWVRGVDIKDLINKFELSNFWKETKLKLITNKYFRIVFPICCLLIVWSLFIHSLLNISSTIRDLKQLEGMPKYKKCEFDTHIFALWFWVPQNYMKICFRNISSAKSKWKECTRRHNYFFSVLGLTQVGYFILKFNWPIFIVVFLPFTAICLVS